MTAPSSPPEADWAHLLRDIHDLRALYPGDASLARWADAVHDVYAKAKAFTHPSEQQRRSAELALEHLLLARCRPYLDDPPSVQARLCRRVEKHIKELFVFVGQPQAPSDNPPEADRRAQPAAAVTSRKISGGTRSKRGTETKMTLASVFGTWRAQDLNPLTTCRQLLASPQP